MCYIISLRGESRTSFSQRRALSRSSASCLNAPKVIHGFQGYICFFKLPSFYTLTLFYSEFLEPFSQISEQVFFKSSVHYYKSIPISAELHNMYLWVGHSLSVLSALWLSRFSIVSGAGESASGAVVPTLTVSSFPLFSTAVLTSATPPPSIPSATRLSVSYTPTTLATASSSTAQNAVTASAAQSQRAGSPTPSLLNHTEVFFWGVEEGQNYGNAVVVNHCKIPMFLSSVGSHRLGGFRDANNDSTSWGTKPEEDIHPIKAGETYTEPYRTTCAIYVNSTKPSYCWPEDKLGGQGISIKISADEHNFTNILQFEYALVRNPLRGDSYRRLDYDISLLDCGNPLVYTQEYKVYIPTSSTSGAIAVSTATGVAHIDGYRDVSQLTDAKATNEDHTLKVKYCPGYEGGLNVTFSNAPNATCPHLICDGKQVCKDIYTFDRSREGEATKACNEVYHGDIVLHLCAGLVAT
ncbi:hypothetical protein HBI52_015670 [Parastagonospora nodorum]|nr:hypothetical protein HBH51_124840 [Parastagonospora nodorum]KAH4025476.1 hypothetical protein HBI09_153970 [Parastagonospora nodorum]KAH4998894.1 hypothetical protein HBI77_180170 [Parastagonospora nodorum]KAH5022569.1 hypothetical protein HBI74_143040 [Parastagonospora nodorum]KAH5373831.1 hypothetical protein HBI48_024580 [Parastagonospora nodorum]